MSPMDSSIKVSEDMNRQNAVITVKECCQRLAISRSHLWQLVNSGRILAIKVGKRGVRIPDSEVNRFIEEGLQAAQRTR